MALSGNYKGAVYFAAPDCAGSTVNAHTYLWSGYMDTGIFDVKISKTILNSSNARYGANRSGTVTVREYKEDKTTLLGTTTGTLKWYRIYKYTTDVVQSFTSSDNWVRIADNELACTKYKTLTDQGYSNKYTSNPTHTFGTIEEKTGYTIVGWTRFNGTKYVGPYAAGQTVTWSSYEGIGYNYYPQYTANTYVVTLDRKGGSSGSTSVDATYNSAMPTIANPVRTGYTFLGYYTGEGGTGIKYYNGDGTSAKNWNIDSATTLYAHWEENSYILTFNSNGGTPTPAAITRKYETETFGNLPVITRRGYTFGGWRTEGGTTITADSKFSDIGAANKTVYARWIADTYNITLNPNHGSSGTTIIYEKYDSGFYQDSGATIIITKITIPTRDGYEFLGYYDGTEKRIEADGTISMVNNTYADAKELLAKWRKLPQIKWLKSGEFEHIYMVKYYTGTEWVEIGKEEGTEIIDWKYYKGGVWKDHI